MLSESDVNPKKENQKIVFNRPNILGIEGFKCGKKLFIIKYLSVWYADTIDTIHFLPPVQFKILSEEEKIAYNWVSNFLHGLFWDECEYPYSYLDQICNSILLRNPNPQFFAERHKNPFY